MYKTYLVKFESGFKVRLIALTELEKELSQLSTKYGSIAEVFLEEYHGRWIPTTYKKIL